LDPTPSPRLNWNLMRNRMDALSAEYTLALARVWITIGVFTAIEIYRPLPERIVLFTQLCVLSYAVYSLLVLAWLRTRSRYTIALSSWLHTVDVLWTGFLCLVARGPAVAPLFLLFVLAAAAHRWGFKGTFKTAVVCVVFLLSMLLGGFGNWPSTQPLPLEPTPARFGTAMLYVAIAGGLLGYLGRKDKQLRIEASARAAGMERARIARELHDGVIQVLFATECQIDVLRRQKTTNSVQVTENLSRIQNLLRENIVAVRELVQRYKPLDLGPQELVGFVGELVRKFQRETGICAQFVSDCDRISLPPSVSHELARIVQEALVNIRKHSGAHNVVVRFGSEKGKWKFVIDDDGRGFDFAGRLSHAELDAVRKGPAIIKERVSTIGGELIVVSNPGHGARLEIELSREVHG
jgi:signal transduction histidine kinase